MAYPKFNPEAELPKTGWLRLPQIIGNPNTTPPIPALIPIGRTSWLNGCRSGKYPKPIKLGSKTTVWRVEDVRKLIEEIV